MSFVAKNLLTVSPKFSPADIPDLELWLDANEGVVNIAGNDFTDETRSIELAGFIGVGGANPNGTFIRQDFLTNGRYPYQGGSSNPEFGGSNIVRWNGSNWELFVVSYVNDDAFQQVTYQSTGGTDYPWQATWTDGTVSPTATTVDTLASDNQTVQKWNNRINGKPALNQSTVNSRPVYKTNVFGRKAVYFNGKALWNSGFSTFGQQYSYYLVSTSLLGSSSTTILHSAIKLGTSPFPSTMRAVFGSTSAKVNFQNSSSLASYFGTVSRTVNNDAAIFSLFADLSNSDVEIARNLSRTALINSNTLTANTNIILIGAANTTGNSRQIDSNFSEVLVYKARHNTETSDKIINYLIAKWNINTSL